MVHLPKKLYIFPTITKPTQLISPIYNINLIHTARELTKCDGYKSSGGTMFSALFSDFDNSLPGPKCVISNQNFEENHSYAIF